MGTPRKRVRAPVGPKRLDAEIEAIVRVVEGLQVELADSVETLRKTVAVNRRDVLGMSMRASEIHSRAVQLLVAAYRAERLRDLHHPPTERVKNVLSDT